MNLPAIQQLLEADMDRKEFLVYLGASVLAVVGVTGLLRSISVPLEKQSKASQNRAGYGSSPYGG